MTILIFVPVNEYDVPPGMAAPEWEAPTQEEAGPTQEEAGPTQEEAGPTQEDAKPPIGATGCGISQEEVDDATSQEDLIHYLEGVIYEYRDEAFASERTISELRKNNNEYRTTINMLRKAMEASIEDLSSELDNRE